MLLLGLICVQGSQFHRSWDMYGLKIGVVSRGLINMSFSKKNSKLASRRNTFF